VLCFKVVKSLVSLWFLLYRFEQQGLFLVEKLTSKDGNNNCDTEDENESRGLVSSQHLAFLISMSRATRRKDWAWFEFAETELNIM
jgi:hypothetical protein